MILIPAIDLHDGKCVQLQRGVLGTASTYGNDAGSMASFWVDEGATRIHVVDLDGAFAGSSINAESIKKVINASGDVEVQLGGGIRNHDAVSYWIDQGISQVILGTQAVEDPEFLEDVSVRFPDRVILGLDARGEYVSTRGWNDTTSITVEEVLASCAELPIHSMVYTDIERDGMLSGINISATEKVLNKAPMPVVASGGIRGMMDLEMLAKLSDQHANLVGVISGSALYEKQLDFKRGQRLLNLHKS